MDQALAYRGKRDLLVERLRQAILEGEYRTGDRLRQDDLAERYGVSQTPVREALRVLETQGLVIHRPNRGVVVADFAGNFDQVYRLRGALEALAVQLAVEHMTEARASQLFELSDQLDAATDSSEREAAHTQFHRVLSAGCEFPALIEMIENVWARFPWHRILVLPGATTSRDHRDIAELAAARRPDAAADRLRTHFETVRAELQARVRDRERDEIADAG
jgi:DNA-binding GntR family transcriptional regulator